MNREGPEFTPLERRVLAMVAEGRTNSFIRVRLGIEASLLTRTLAALYRKTGIHQSKEPFIPKEVRERLAEWGQGVL
jgi:DNA-binding CsgD family transcriptional regulator